MLDAATDVHFNNNSAALVTTLGANLAVCNVNFVAGAAAPVTVGGANTLSIGVGGITMQRGTGAHTISAAVSLSADQTWGQLRWPISIHCSPTQKIPPCFSSVCSSRFHSPNVQVSP